MLTNTLLKQLIKTRFLFVLFIRYIKVHLSSYTGQQTLKWKLKFLCTFLYTLLLPAVECVCKSFLFVWRAVLMVFGPSWLNKVNWIRKIKKKKRRRVYKCTEKSYVKIQFPLQRFLIQTSKSSLLCSLSHLLLLLCYSPGKREYTVWIVLQGQGRNNSERVVAAVAAAACGVGLKKEKTGCQCGWTAK